MCLVGIPRVGKPAVGLHEGSGSKVLVLVPPVGRARGRTAGSEDALIQTVKFLAVFWGLKELALGGRIIVLKVGLNGLVLLVE